MWVKLILISMFGCSGSLTSTFDIRGIVNGDRMASVPLGISLGAGQLDVEGICTMPGMACQNCSLAVTCIPLPAGWLKLPLEECVKGLTCNAHLGRCFEEPVPECDARSLGYKHSCEQVGIFPDAYDCRKFHLCSPPEGLPDGRPADHRTALCPRHYGYNPQTAQCSVRLTHGQCVQKTVPDCSTVGEYGVLPSSPNHYYVCLSRGGILQPQIFLCPNGWFFWDGFCRPEPKPTEILTSENEREVPFHFQMFLDFLSDPTTTQETITTEELKATEESTTSRMSSFFSTDKPISYPKDTFLADKFDLVNYESIDDVVSGNGNEDPYNYDAENGDWNTFDK